MSAITIMLGAFGFMSLFTAAISIPHKMLGYRRADLLTVLSFAALAGLCFASDPLHGVVGKKELYILIAGLASLFGYIGLKIEETFGHVVFALIVAPALAAFIAPLLYVLALAADITDYRPPKPPPRLLAKAVHALGHRPKQKSAQ